jgi:hypothetical protein
MGEEVRETEVKKEKKYKKRSNNVPFPTNHQSLNPFPKWVYPFL